MRLISLILIAVILFTGCATSKQSSVYTVNKSVSISALKFLNEYDIPFNTVFKGTRVGGLSGIDYDRENNKYYIISDDRSATSAARFYTAAIDISNDKIDTVRFINVAALRDVKNDTFPSLQVYPEHAADPESIRYNRLKKNLVWSSEGDKAVRSGRMVYQNPWIFEMDVNGSFRDTFLIPDNLHMYKGDSGARENEVLEGLSFTPDYKYLWSSMEGPIYEDGPLATPAYANAPVRFTKYDVNTKKALGQYAYLLDAVANKPTPENAFNINGVSENLYIGNNKFLVLERSFSTGTINCVIKIYLADFSRATDVLKINSLYKNDHYTPASKSLLFNFNTLDRRVDNVEGITLGPVLPNGHLSLILIVDNNFNPLEPQQVFLFEIIP